MTGGSAWSGTYHHRLFQGNINMSWTYPTPPTNSGSVGEEATPTEKRTNDLSTSCGWGMKPTHVRVAAPRKQCNHPWLLTKGGTLFNAPHVLLDLGPGCLQHHILYQSHLSPNCSRYHVNKTHFKSETVKAVKDKSRNECKDDVVIHDQFWVP